MLYRCSVEKTTLKRYHSAVIYHSGSEKETQKIASELASKVIKSLQGRAGKKALIITLEGELGAGKTTFIRGFLKSLGVKDKVKSPTFVLMRHYHVKLRHAADKTLKSDKEVYHLDCYRVRDHRDLSTLDLKSLFKSPNSIVLIEWPERISKILPRKLTKIHIDHIDKNKRKIQIYTK